MVSFQLRRALVAVGIIMAFVGVSSAQARAPQTYLKEGGVFSKGWEYAVGGFDVVAYFGLEQGSDPVAGSDEFTTQYQGASWRFSSQENLDKFIVSPSRYSPEFGGYCAWAMARDKLAHGDPAVWHIHQGVLYLNVSRRYQKKWRSDLEHEIELGNANWPNILDRN